MEDQSTHNRPAHNPESVQNLTKALQELDQEMVDLDGRQLKPSACYRVNLDPLHILFNTNCPDTLKEKVEALMNEHLGDQHPSPDES